MSTSQNHSANKATARALLCLFFPLGGSDGPRFSLPCLTPASPLPSAQPWESTPRKGTPREEGALKLLPDTFAGPQVALLLVQGCPTELSVRIYIFCVCAVQQLATTSLGCLLSLLEMWPV